MNLKLDDKDWKILFELQRDSRISMAELGRKVSLSSPSVHARVSKLEDKGVIHSYKTIVDHIKAGFQLKAMIMLRVFMGKLNPFLDVVPSFKEVVNCYRVTGNENIIMEVVFVDQFHLEKFIDKLIKYGETRTHIILSEVVSDAPLNKPIKL